MKHRPATSRVVTTLATFVVGLGALAGCAVDRAADKAGRWLAEQPHIAHVRDGHAVRSGELSAALGSSGALVEADLEPGTSPDQLVGLSGGVRELVDSSRALTALTLLLHGDHFDVVLRGDSDLDGRRLRAASTILAVPGVAFVDLTEYGEGGGPLVRLEAGEPADVAPQVFSAAATLVDGAGARRAAAVTAPGRPTVRMEIARPLTGPTARLLRGAAGWPGVREVVVGPTALQAAARWDRPIGARETVEVPGLPTDADVMTVVADSPSAAARLLPLASTATRGTGTEIFVEGGPLRLSTRTEPALARRLVALSENVDAVAVEYTDDRLDVELRQTTDEAVDGLPELPQVRLRTTFGWPVELLGSTTEVRRELAWLEAAGHGAAEDDLWGLRADPETIEVLLGADYAGPFDRFVRAVHVDGSPSLVVVQARLSADTMLGLRFRVDARGRAADPTWDLANFPDGDRALVDRAAHDLLAVWDGAAQPR
ncbi:MAG: hypothetical protein U0R80_16610 [Nocardioidaceae bacterium]